MWGNKRWFLTPEKCAKLIEQLILSKADLWPFQLIPRLYMSTSPCSPDKVYVYLEAIWAIIA